MGLILRESVKLRSAMAKSLMMFVLVFVVSLACAAQQTQTSTTMKQGMGVLEGKVTISPLRPGPQRDRDTDVPPPEVFTSHKVIIFSASDKSRVKEVQADSRGAYRIELPPGKYLVDFEPHDIGMPRLKAPLPDVTITAGETSTLNLDIDTGMR